jgi:predicted TIM-barrel fold metal-dependent hydrolase
MKRRTFLQATVAASMTDASAQPAGSIPVIDTHIHLFDTNRKQGVPWPTKDNKVLFKPALPERYRKIATPFGIKGAIEVECSTWLEDNQWVLDIAAKDSIIVGTVGDLEPGKPEFAKNLERFHKSPLFLGIRYGNLWDRNLGAELKKREFVADLKLLAQAGLVLDTANPDAALMRDVVRVSDLVPELRVVIDHLPQADPKDFEGELKEFAKRPQLYVKVSQILRRVDGKVPLALNFYRDRLDRMYEVFGEDRVLYGSDWPNSDQWAEYPAVFGLVREYFTAKGPKVAEKYFWRNSVGAYRWVKREAGQPGG